MLYVGTAVEPPGLVSCLPRDIVTACSGVAADGTECCMCLMVELMAERPDFGQGVTPLEGCQIYPLLQNVRNSCRTQVLSYSKDKAGKAAGA